MLRPNEFGVLEDGRLIRGYEQGEHLLLVSGDETSFAPEHYFYPNTYALVLMQFLAGKDLFEVQQEVLFIVRLRDEIVSSTRETLKNIFRVGQRRQQDHRNVLAALIRFDMFAEFVAAHLRHNDVANDQRRFMFVQMGKGLLAAARYEHHVVLLLQEVHQLRSLCGAVFHDKDFYTICRVTLWGFHIFLMFLLVVKLTNAAAILSGGRTYVAAPSLIASPGMPCTTELSSSCAMVIAPISFSVFNSSAPSLPMPVNITPTAAGPNTCAIERNR